jgi:hypothetical protein
MDDEHHNIILIYIYNFKRYNILFKFVILSNKIFSFFLSNLRKAHESHISIRMGLYEQLQS